MSGRPRLDGGFALAVGQAAGPAPMTTFDRDIGIDYSGAQTPTSSLTGLRVYMADRASPPIEVPPPPSPRKYWTRRGVAEWLVEPLAKDASTLVGIDHGFSFPLRYFEVHGLAPGQPPPSDPGARITPRSRAASHGRYVTFQ